MKTQLQKARALNGLGHQMGSQDRRSGLGQVCPPAVGLLAVDLTAGGPLLEGVERLMFPAARCRAPPRGQQPHHHDRKSHPHKGLTQREWGWPTAVSASIPLAMGLLLTLVLHLRQVITIAGVG